MIRRRLLAATLLLWACGDEKSGAPMAKPIDECEGLPAITVSANPPTIRVNGASTVHATGGTGRYTYQLAPDGSGGELRGERLVAGPTPSADHLTVSDECGNTADLEVSVSASFSVAPSRARIRPGTSFQIAVTGALGAATFRADALGSGGSLSAEGHYQAGSQTGLDLIVVHDEGSGDEVLLQYRVDPAARFRGAPELLAAPSGASHKLQTIDGSNVSTWTITSGPGSVEDGIFSSASGETGVTTLQGTDSFTQEQTEIRLKLLDELTHDSRPHGRLTDQATLATGDFDGDGLMDAALGVPESDLSKPTGGAVFIFKGSELGLPDKPTWTILGEYDTANLGAVLAAGDLDGDGQDDLAVSEPGADVTSADSGAVLLFKFTDKGPEPLRAALTGLGRGNFGAALAIVDVDADGDSDLVVGSPGADLAASSNVNSRGVVDVFVLQKGSPIPDSGMVRIGGSDLAADGKFKVSGGLRFGRSIAVADFNGDGRVDLASLGTVNNSGAGARAQSAVAVHFGRDSSPLFVEKPDLYIAPNHAPDTSEGTFRLRVAPPVGQSKASRILVSADGLDSPDLSSKGGVKSGGNSGGAYLYDLSAHGPADGVPEQPTQLLRGDAFARIWGDSGGAAAGRSSAFVDLDGDGSLELVLGAPYASSTTKVNNRDVTTPTVGKVLVYPYAALNAGDELNKPLDARIGSNANDALGVAVTAFSPGMQSGLLALAARATTDAGDFTGRLDAFLGTGPLSSRSASSCALPARLSAQQRGFAIELLRQGNTPAVLVGAPGFAGLGAKGDGNELGAGRALLFSAATLDQGTVIHEGASAPYTSDGHPAFGGRMVGQDVGVSDFNGDGLSDLIVAAPQLSTPTTSSTDYAANIPACLTSNAQGNGGALVFLNQGGSYKEGFRLFAVADIAGCTPADNAACKRRELARNGLTGGFDFNGDGKQDVLLTRANGLEIFLGRAPTDASLNKPSMVCDSVLTLPALGQGTSAPAALGDLDADGCDEVAVRYSSNDRSGLLIAFGFDAAGIRCDGNKEAVWLRLSGDAETGQNSNLQLGIASARAGRLLGGTQDYVAISAGLYPFEGVQQPTVLLYSATQLAAERPLKGEAVVGALNDGLTPIPLVYQERAPGFGRALSGNVDFNGDGLVDLVVSAPGVALHGGGTGVVYVFLGGTNTKGRLSSWLTVVGDGSERANVGQDLSVLRAGGGWPAMLGIGAPLSNRTGTANGTAWLLPIPF